MTSNCDQTVTKVKRVRCRGIIEVKNYDPLKSLDGGIDGVQSYRAIFSGIKELLSKDGLCLFEIGFDILESVKALLKEFDLKLIKIHKDLRGCDRVLEIR